MRYDLKNILWSLTAAVALGLAYIPQATAQGVLSLEDDASSGDVNDELGLSIDSPEIPDSIDVPAPGNTDGSGMITPPAGKIVPKTGTVVPKTGAVTPKTGAIVPKTGAVTPKTGAAPAADGPIALPSPDNNAAPNLRPEIPLIEEAEVVGNEGGALQPKNPLENQPFDETDDEVFSQMSDLEKQTAILTLELRREKVKNEIEALQAQRRKAIEEEALRNEEQRLKLAEQEKEQEKKILEERQKLRELDLAYEKLRQEKLLNSYKNKMLADNQKWIENNAAIYAQVTQLKKENQEFTENIKKKMLILTEAADKASKNLMEAKERYQREKASLQTQISILKARLEAEEKTNPFAEAAAAAEEKENEVRLNDVYVIMEIRGQGGKLAAKLVNKDGMPFLVQEGTTLQTGHVVDEITTTYIRADKAGKKDYLYFSAGGILEKEPEKAAAVKYNMDSGEKKPSGQRNTTTLPVSRGIPGIGQDMTIR